MRRRGCRSWDYLGATSLRCESAAAAPSRPWRASGPMYSAVIVTASRSAGNSTFADARILRHDLAHADTTCTLRNGDRFLVTC